MGSLRAGEALRRAARRGLSQGIKEAIVKYEAIVFWRFEFVFIDRVEAEDIVMFEGDVTT